MATWNDIPEHYRNALLVSDVLDYLRGFPDASVPMFLFSPPYNLGNSTGGAAAHARRRGHYPAHAPHGKRGGNGKWYGGPLAGYDLNEDNIPWDVYIPWQQSIIRECWRALMSDGAIYYNHKPRILNGTLFDPVVCIPDEIPLLQRVIWLRDGGVNFNPTYYLPMHEYIYVVAKPDFRLRDRAASGAGDVWRIAAEKNTWHPAPFPLALAERAIETVMPAFVVDPFAGSGTTARAAKRYGIGYSGCDLSAAYLEKARAAVAAERTLTHRQTRIDDVLADQAVCSCTSGAHPKRL